MTFPSATVAATGPVLRDIHLPPAPAWWPPAPGWWCVAVLLLALAVLAVWLWRKRHARRLLEAALLGEVDALLSQWRNEPQKLASGLHQLLRRGALRYDAGAAHRHGDEWRHTLAIIPVDTTTLDRLMTLEDAMYRPGASFDIEATVASTRHWLRLAWRHRAARKVTTARPAIAESSHA
jgi:Domain of unknown function (DUF4381)